MPLRERDDLEPLDPLSAAFVNAEQEFLGAAQSNFLVRIKPGDSTVLQVPAGSGDARAAIAIEGRWRWVDATIERASIGGVARTLDLYVTAAESVYTAGTPGEVDSTNRSFALALVEHNAAAPAGVDLTRKVAEVVWDGAAFTAVNRIVGGTVVSADTDLAAAVATLQLVAAPIGSLMTYAGSGDPAGGTWLLADGRLVDRTTYAAFFAAVGHSYNGGVDPGSNKVRLPDKRGRVSVGADNMGSALGAAGRLPNSNRARGQNGGEERHLLTGAESGVKAHAHSASQTTHHHGFAGGATALNAGGGYNAFTPGSGVSVGTTTQTDDQTPAVTVSNATAVSADNAHNVMQPYEVDNVIVRVA